MTLTYDLERYTLPQNFIELSAAVHELSCVQRKNSDENNTARRYRADSRNKQRHSEVSRLGLTLPVNCW